MENYDPSFSTVAREGDILACGYNMGCESSREQAATTILAKKLLLVVAASFRQYIFPEQYQQRSTWIGTAWTS